jgi:hypothetical protein
MSTSNHLDGARSTGTHGFDFAMTACSRFPFLKHATILARLLNYVAVCHKITAPYTRS